MKRLVLFLCLSALGFSQIPQPTPGHVDQLYYSGSLLQYVCEASATVAPTTVQFSDASLTSVAVSSNTATVTTASNNYLWTGARVTIAGSATTALNGTYTVTATDNTGIHTTYTVTTSGVSNGTYTTGIVITTNSPLLITPVWAITVLHYASTVLDGTYPGGGSASQSYSLACTNRASY